MQPAYQRVYFRRDSWYHHVLLQHLNVLILFAIEDIEANNMALSPTMLTSHGLAYFHNPAGAVFDNDATVRAERRARHRISQCGIVILLEAAMSMCNHFISISAWKAEGRELTYLLVI